MKASKTIFLGLFVILHFSCSYQLKENEAPDDLIPKDTFTLVLQEVMIVESYFKSQEANVNSFYQTLPAAMHPIFEKYNIDSSRYVKSMNYYTTQQEFLIEIYNEIQDILTLNTRDLPQ